MQRTKDIFKLPVTHRYIRFFLISVILCSMLILTACSKQSDSDLESSPGQTVSQESEKKNNSKPDSKDQTADKATNETDSQVPEQSSETESESSFSEGSSASSEASESTSEPAKTTHGEPNPDEKVVYITIDDGPSSNTAKILDILDQYDAKATWFVTSQYMEGNELSDMLKEIHDRGHAVGVHTFSHRYKDIYKSVDAYMSDYNKMNKIIVTATGEDSSIFRFPGGSNASYNKNIRAELIKHVKSKGLVYYDWNAFTGDTDGLSRSQMVSKAVKESGYNNKTILLMHDVPNKDTVIEALPEILSSLKDKGYEFRALDKEVTPIQFEK